MILTTKENLEKAILNGKKIDMHEVFYIKELDNIKNFYPPIGSLYKGGIYIGEYNGKEIVMCLKDEPEQMTWDEAMNIEGRRPLSILEWKIYEENKEIIDEALKKYGDELLKDWYWSSSEYIYNYTNAWVVRPSDGVMYYTNNRVRCVLAF